MILPVPFSGSLTSETNVLIAEGDPVGIRPGSSLRLSAFSQSSMNGLPLSWELFDSHTGVSDGMVTFNSMTAPQLSSFSSGGVKRAYTLDACATFAGGREACSSHLECFEYPTDYTPSTDLVQFASTISGAHAEVRKLACSGNIDKAQGDVTLGQLLTGKFVIGSACLPGDSECLFHTQLESAVIIDGSNFSSLNGNPNGKVVFSMITQGPDFPHPVPTDPLGINFHILLPGSDQIAGEFFGASVPGSEGTIPPNVPLDQAEAIFGLNDGEFQLNDSQSSRLVVHNVRILTHRIPELDEPIRQFLRDNFAGTPGVTERLLNEGVYIFNSVEESQSDVINCDPNLGEATGVFQDLCTQFSPMRATFLCTTLAVLTDPPTNDAFMFTGVWSIIQQ